MPERCMQMLKQIITEIENRQNITRDQLALLLETTDTGDIAFLHERARKTADAIYGKQVFIRGLIEFTNYCKNDCIYCGIRKSNRKAERYRLTEEEILSCCANGYELGFRTFVLQGGEDPYFTDDKICALIRQIKAQYPDCAVTLSIGEKEHDSYQAFFDAGADRYLLRHETADEAHYGKLHPAEMFWKHRMDCLWDLKEIGYQVGCGFMVGSPEIAAAYGRHRSVYSPEGYPVWRKKGRNNGRYASAFIHYPAVAAACAAAINNCTGNHSSAGQGKRNSGRGKCCDAESFPGSSAGKI